MHDQVEFSQDNKLKFDARLAAAVDDPARDEFSIGVDFSGNPPAQSTLSSLGVMITGTMAVGQVNRQQLKELSSRPEVKLISLFGQSRLR